jgi:aryl-alcohol dehydrogenase-like predicted oxidoreductase
LERLQTDHVDLLQLHNPFSLHSGRSADTLLDVLSQAKREGLCRFVGVAVGSANDATDWAATGAIQAIQLPAGIQELAELARIRSSTNVQLIGREVFSGGRIFDPMWRAEALAAAPAQINGIALPTDLDGLGYLRWLTESGLVDIALIGSRNSLHIAAAAQAVGLPDRKDST